MQERVDYYKNYSKVKPANNILQIGYGAIGRALTPILKKMISYKSHTIIDKRQLEVPSYSKFVHLEITPTNYKDTFDKYLQSGDILIDVSTDIGTYELVEYCLSHNVMFFNMSVEEFDRHSHSNLQEFTLYHRNRRIAGLTSVHNPTIILDTGMNPGWVSAAAKMGMDHIIEQFTGEKYTVCKKYQEQKAYNLLAREIGLKTIHITEKDTQVTTKPRQPDEFVNTWSVAGLAEEVSAPAELGWGTHEPEDPRIVKHSSTSNQVCTKIRGCNMFVESYTRMGKFIGYLVRHGEAYSISSRLTVENNEQPTSYVHRATRNVEQKSPVYRPSVYFVYLPCDAGQASVHKLRETNYELSDNLRNLYDDITDGVDEIGCLMMGDFGTWWIGSSMDIHETRMIADPATTNATTIQAAGSLVASLCYALDHPNEGLCFVDDIDHNEYLEVANMFMGPIRSSPIKMPISNYTLKDFCDF